MSNNRIHSEEEKTKLETKLNVKNQLTVDVASGLFTGVFCSGLFNPWDRALYLSVKNNIPFLSIDNFRHPYHGFSQAVLQRAFLGSVYYIMQGELKSHLYPYLRHDLKASETFSQFCIGSSAGSISGLLTNGISAVKYHTWGQENRSFFSSSYDMWSNGRFNPFIKGTKATIGRDFIFGSTYEVSRHLMRNKLPNSKSSYESYLNFVCNLTSAGLATVASGPLNYARTIQYATPPQQKPPAILQSLRNVWEESKRHKTHTFSKMSFFQQKFRIGWGTARVSVGMAVGQNVFDIVSTKLKSS